MRNSEKCGREEGTRQKGVLMAYKPENLVCNVHHGLFRAAVNQIIIALNLECLMRVTSQFYIFDE